ncbi:hypothetical protein LQ764DRAFT_210335 [Zygosaccharomyces rouxii]|nr:hypothetical protein LQ764DRAFT_210335 [Zygosaccharomyces rouxii]
MSVMSATESNAGRLAYDDQFDEMHNLGGLFTPQELPLDDSFEQDFDHLSGFLDLHGLQGAGGTGDNGTPNTQASTPIPSSEKRPPLARRARSNPFYCPSRQIMNLVQKKKISKKIKKENSDAFISMLSLSQSDSQSQQVMPREFEEKVKDAGSSYNTQTEGSP